jgi:hypothetical protein
MYWGEDRVPIQIVGADENAELLTRLAGEKSSGYSAS